jgi:citrate lyase subunit beta / citryl-CoA lyase
MRRRVGVRISAATPAADLDAAVWPGVSAIVVPRAESAAHVRRIDAHVASLERRRGIRPGSVKLWLVVDSARGVADVFEIAASSARSQALGVGPGLHVVLGLDPAGEAVDYARAECELVARVRGLAPLALEHVLD